MTTRPILGQVAPIESLGLAVLEAIESSGGCSIPQVLADINARALELGAESRQKLDVLIASELARIDGYEPDDENGGLYDLHWSGGPNPEPEGDAWSMDYLPKGERIAAAILRARATPTGATP